MIAATAGCKAQGATELPERVGFVLGADRLGGFVVAPEHAEVDIEDEQVTIHAGDHFSFRLARGGLDLQAEQARVIDDKRLQLQEFVTHSADTLIWRWGMTDAADTYHFAYTSSVAGEPYYCRSSSGHRFTLAEIEVMLEACRSVHFEADAP